MEENKKNNKKLPLLITIATMLVCCTVFTVLCAIGLIPIPTGNGKFYSVKTASAVKKSYQVEDEATLRELLLLNEELDIVVTKDIKISEPLIVKGTKTLYGDATISSDLSGEFRTMYMLDVQVGASLTWDGPTLDSDGSADGINVNQKAELNIKSGTLQYLRDAVYSNGTVTMTGGLIQHVSQNGIIAAFRSKVYVNGGTLYNGGGSLLNVETNGYAEVNEGATFKTSRGDTIFNAGELNIYGGTICDTIARAINTEGKLHMEYKGEKKDGYIEMYNIGSIAVRMTSSDDCYISDVHGVNIGTNGVFTTDLRSNGKTTVENCIFDTCAIVEGNGMSVSRKVEIKDVQILNSHGGGINCRTNCDIKVDGLLIDGTNGTCLSIYDDFEGKNITLRNVKKNNVVLYSEVEASFTDCVFEKSVRTNVFCTANTVLNMENVQIEGVTDDGIFAIQCNAGSTVNMIGDDNVIAGSTRVGVCLYKGATLNMEGGKICDNHGSANGAGVWVREEGSTFNMKGGTICDNTTTGSSGAVFVANKATFNMSGGTITNNKADYSGGAVQVQGVMNMSGGTISGNWAGTTGGGINVGNNVKKEIYGTLNMTGGTIENNEATTNGGGISVSGKATANVSGGTIKNNKAGNIGNGIADNGNLTLSKNVAVTGNDVGMVNRDVILKIKGNALNKHSANNPLVVTPNYKTKPNSYVVIECDDEAAAAKMLNTYVKSGSKVYTFIQNSKQANQLVVNVNDVDVDMNTAGAETVYVSNFQQLKEAVETTETKRNIVIGADIVMESLITVPAEATVCIRDDGQTRTLTRDEKHTTLFFETWYGTGLVLEGTSEGKLVLDGKTSGEVTLKNVNSLVKVRGTTEITNVAFKNNGNTTASIAGAFVNNEYGHATIESCSFTNGIGSNGGAIYSAAEDMTVTDCTFTNNTAKERGGAIYTAKTATVVENTTFKNNTAAGSGGAIHNASSGTLTLTGTNSDAIFEGNAVLGTLEKDNYGGGAICVGTGNATITGYTFKKNETKNTDGGAVELRSVNTVASITDCTFDANKSASEGGAITSRAKKTVVENTTFTNNEATGQGGAILSHGKELSVTDCDFSNNIATGNGGAIYGGSGGIMTLTSSKNATFESNTSSTNGGAICVGTGVLTVEGYEFIDNKAVYGGAIRVNGDKNVEAVITDSVFTKNAATANGGAISNASKKTYEEAGKAACTITACEFSENTSVKHGGAIFHENSVMSVSDSTFTANSATGNGGAMYPDASSTLNVNVCKFDGNSATNNGGAIYNAGGSTTTIIGDAGEYAIFANNIANTETTDKGGGAICVGSGAVSVTGYAFENNEGIKGGAIYSNAKLEITDTSFTANESSSDGGAIYGKNGSLTLTATKDVAFDGNKSTGSMGGAIYMDVGTVSVTGYDFTNNSASNGGAVRLAGSVSTAAFTECEFANNKADGGYGGAISNNSTSDKEDAVIITDCVFEKNTAKYGAAIHNRESELKLVGTKEIGAEGAAAVMKGNEATTSGQGGAIWVEGGNLKIDKYEFETNVSKDRGGAIWTKEGSTGIISNSVFTGNTAGGGGGAIHKEGVLTITNTDFISNTSTGAGGAINNEKGNVIIQNCDFISNQATSGNGGAIQAVGSSATVTIEVTDGQEHIFQNNIAGTWNEDGTAKNEKVGGAIRHNTATLIVKGYKFEGNTATTNGGAVYIDAGGAASTFENNTFVNNTASNGSGAAIYAMKSMTITGGTFDGNTSASSGGAIYVGAKAITVIVKGVTFVKNVTSGGNGGAIYNASTLTTANDATAYGLVVEDCVFGKDEDTTFKYANTAVKSNAYGGAIHTPAGLNTKIVDSAFYYNRAHNGGAIGTVTAGIVTIVADDNASNAIFKGNSCNNQGGAIRFYGCADGTSITGYTFESNTSPGNGGAVQVDSTATLTISHCTFNANSAATGGAIQAYGSTNITVTNGSSFTGNTATGQAGAIYSKGTLTVEDSNFTSNTAGTDGGAIHSEGGTKYIKNSKFVSNTSGRYGGAISSAASSTTTITGMKGSELSIFKNNTATTYGGAVYNGGSGKMYVYNYTFEGNTGGTGNAIFFNLKSNTAFTVGGCTFKAGQNIDGKSGFSYKEPSDNKNTFE